MTYDEAVKRWPRFCGTMHPANWGAPDGWDAPISKLCDLLERIPEIVCVHIKEKFGGLRCYIDPADADDDPVVQWTIAADLIAACEEACWNVCQRCGETPASTVNRKGWLHTLCVGCREGVAPGGFEPTT